MYISDSAPQPQRRYAGVPVRFTHSEGNPVRCQTANHQANIEALVELTVADSDPNNNATSTSATCGGVQVYFRSRDPDSGTLWDTTPGLAGDNNVDTSVGEGRGTVAPEVSVAEANQTGDFPARTAAVATTTLTFTDHQAGDNYVVDASTCRMPATAAQASSGILTAWKLIYYERDRMLATGRLLADHAAIAGEDHLDLQPGGNHEALNGRTILVFDPAHQDPTDVLQQHQVTAVVGDRLMITPPLNYSYEAGPVGAIGVVQTPMFVDAVDLGRLGVTGEFGSGFVEWRQHPGLTRPRGVYPTRQFRGFQPELLPYFETREQPNVVHLIDGMCFDPTWGSADRAGMAYGFEAIVMSRESDMETFMPPNCMSETTVHECGHFFGLEDFNHRTGAGHLDHPNHAGSDGCVMLFWVEGALFNPTHPNDFENGVAAFGGSSNPLAGEPVDLRDHIAGGPASLPGASPPTP